jgi:dUTP pyrophosphatase
MIELKFKKLHPDAHLPKRWSEESVGYDLHAFCLSETGRPIKQLIPPHATRNISTGLLIEPPPGHFIMVCSRSGLAKLSVMVANAPGIIDPDYRGEIKVLIYNGSFQSYYVSHEDRIAQIVVVPVTPISVVEADALSETGRGEKGFGSTGGLSGN